MTRYAPPYRIQFNPALRMFDVYLDGKVVGSHKGRGAAEAIGRKALVEQRAREISAAAVSDFSSYDGRAVHDRLRPADLRSR